MSVQFEKHQNKFGCISQCTGLEALVYLFICVLRLIVPQVLTPSQLLFLPQTYMKA